MKKYNFVCVQTIFNERMDTKKLRQKILDLAIHGKLVPQDPNDEPASVLLERIRAEKERLIAEGKIKRSKKSATSDTPHYENEVPFEVPEGWEWVSLSEIAHSCLGKMLDKAKNQGTLQPYLRNVNVRWGTFELEDLLQMPFVEEEDERFSVVQGDLVVCEGGEPGRCAIWENNESIKFQKALHRIRCFNGALNYYIKIVIEWYAASKNIELYYTGSTIKHLTGEALNTLQIPLPPIQEQHHIVSIVDQWMSLIDLFDTESSELKQSIEKAKSKILDLAIHGKLVPKDPNDEPASELLKRINPKAVASCDNPHYGKVPSSWVISTVGEVFTINPKTHAEDDTEAAFVPMTCVADGYSNTFEYECRKWGDIKKGFVHFQENDVAVAKISPCLENRKSVVFHDLPNGIGAGTTELNVFRCAEVLPEYALFYFKSKMFIGSCAGTYNGVVGQQRVAKSFIQELPIGIPPYNEQLRIVSKVNDLFSHLDMIEKSLQA